MPRQQIRLSQLQPSIHIEGHDLGQRLVDHSQLLAQGFKLTPLSLCADDDEDAADKRMSLIRPRPPATRAGSLPRTFTARHPPTSPGTSARAAEGSGKEDIAKPRHQRLFLGERELGTSTASTSSDCRAGASAATRGPPLRRTPAIRREPPRARAARNMFRLTGRWHHQSPGKEKRLRRLPV